MRNFLIRLLVNAVAIAVMVYLFPGFQLADDSFQTVMIVALIFGVVNAIIKPIVTFLSCPLIVITLGVIFIVINAAMLLLTALISNGRLTIQPFWWALVGGIFMMIVGIVTENLLGLAARTVRVKEVKEVRYIVEERRQDLDRDFYSQAGAPPPDFNDSPFGTPPDDPDFGNPRRPQQ